MASLRQISSTLAVAGALAAASPAHGSVTIHLTDQAGAPAAAVQKAEQAVAWQVRHDVQPHWHVPPVDFTASAAADFTAYLQTGTHTGLPGRDLGEHWSDRTIYIRRTPHWSATLSHEVIESLVDPLVDQTRSGTPVEVADPVGDETYPAPNGALVSDFVYPRWFVHGSNGPWDAMDTAPMGPLHLGDGVWPEVHHTG